MLAAVIVAIAATIVWLYSTWRLGVLHELHHFWYGVPLVVVGSFTGALWLVILGDVVMVDDALQHLVQLRRPAFRSPLHRLYAVTLYRWTHGA